jgi:hypothetical protein
MRLRLQIKASDLSLIEQSATRQVINLVTAALFLKFMLPKWPQSTDVRTNDIPGRSQRRANLTIRFRSAIIEGERHKPLEKALLIRQSPSWIVALYSPEIKFGFDDGTHYDRLP